MVFQYLHSGDVATITGFIALYLVLRMRSRVDPAALRFPLFTFSLGVILECLAGVPHRLGLVEAAVIAAGVGEFLEGVGAISLAGQGVFRSLIPRAGFTAPRILQDVTLSILFLVWGLYELQAHGVNITGIIATSAVLTGIIGFAMQDTLGNVLAGLAIEIDGSVQVGDWVKIDDLSGRVTETTWRYTAIETRNWETLLIPNSHLLKNRLVLLGQREGQPLQWRRWVYFNVDYRYPPTQVIPAIDEALKNAEIPRVSRTPAPHCILMDLSESYGRYAVRYWLTEIAVDDPTDSAVRTLVVSALYRNGMTLSLPAHAVFLTQLTEERKAIKTAHELAMRVSILKRIDLFANLKEEELNHLAVDLVDSPFVAGEVMTRQGAEAHWLYIIYQGRADVLVTNREGTSIKVAELGAGNFFGEWSLLTGEPRHATVIASTPIRSFRLDRDAFRKILQVRPGLAEEISGILAKRRTELDNALVNETNANRDGQTGGTKTSIMAKILTFFGLEKG